MTARPSHQKVVITIDDHEASVPFGQRDLVAAELTAACVRWTATAGATTGCRDTHAFGRRAGAAYRFPARLALPVAIRLRARGVDCAVRPWVTTATPGWDAAPDPLRELIGDPRAFGFGGIIPRGPSCDPRVLVPDLIRLVPNGRAVVATRNRRGVTLWHRHLSRAGLGRPVVRAGDPDAWAPDAVHVCSLAVLDQCRTEDFALAVVTDAEPLRATPLTRSWQPKWSAGGEWQRPVYPVLQTPLDQRGLCRRADPRVPAFGFAPALATLSGAELLTLSSFFGPVLSTQGKPVLRVTVRSVAAQPVPAQAVPSGDLLSAKRAVWADPARNALIAALAGRAAADGDAGVVVLTASADHAGRIASALAGWARVSDDAPGPLPARAIITEGRLVRPGGRMGSGTVIDARGWGTLAPADFERDAEVTLVDVAATGHSAVERRTGERACCYSGYGWLTKTND